MEREGGGGGDEKTPAFPAFFYRHYPPPLLRTYLPTYRLSIGGDRDRAIEINQFTIQRIAHRHIRMKEDPSSRVPCLRNTAIASALPATQPLLIISTC